MIDHELLHDVTESYLKSLMSEASDTSVRDFDSFAPFGELGINSFHVLKIIKRLEVDFGTLPKSLLFERFNINDLANYFAEKHEQTLCTKFAAELQRAESFIQAGSQPAPAAVVQEQVVSPAPSRPEPVAPAPVAEAIRLLEKDAFEHPELKELVGPLFARYKSEGCVSRGTRKIAPNLFIGSERRGYFNYSRSRNLILVYGYTGPRDYLPVLVEEMYLYCTAKGFQLNIFADENVPAVGSLSFSATPFGVMQRVVGLKQFTLDGGPMRRLRYQVSKFQKTGRCRTEEYHAGSNPETDRKIGVIIDRWCESRTVVNPLVPDVKGEIFAGTLPPEHRLFLTYLDDVLQNVILITAMSAEANGYLMDLEFYLPDMPLGGLEFAIVQIIETLVAEGCDVLSLGGTYGCKLEPSPNADPDIDRILDDLREQNIFNDEGNLQFKNKFRPENDTIYLCRPVGSGNPDSVIDIIMMIADPLKMQTPDVENHNALDAPASVISIAPAPVVTAPAVSIAPAAVVQPAVPPAPVVSARAVSDGNGRPQILEQFGFNPLNLPHEHVEFDLKTDSWAQLHMPAIDAQMKYLHAKLQQPGAEESLRVVFPFAHHVLTPSGQAAENVFFKAWPAKGLVLQNLLFPSTIFHEIDKGFANKELPDRTVFDLTSDDPYKGNMDWDALQKAVAQDPGAISFVCIEVGNNAAGGAPVSMGHLKAVKALLAPHSIPLVLDGTRVVENAQLLIEREEECAGKSVWAVVREIFSHADAVIGSLTKDFCVNKGGIIATNDVKLFDRLRELVDEEGAGIDLIDTKMIALALHDRKQIEARVLRRMEAVRRVWAALDEHHVPVVKPAGGHCVLVDVREIPEFKGFGDPVASFVAWLYLSTGIRAAAHNAGMQRNTRLNDLVRLAIPVGLKRDQIDSLIDRFVQAYATKGNIPEIVKDSSAPGPSGGVYSGYKLVKYHNVPAGQADAPVPAIAAAAPAVAAVITPAAHAPAPEPPAPAPQPAAPVAPAVIVTADAAKETEPSPMPGKPTQNRTRDIAIVGMAGRYPKAKNLSELWENLAQGRDCIEDIPADRYERRLQYEAVAKYRGGFIDDVDKFDSLFFNISPREAEVIDPQERLFLEVVWETFEDAGYYPEILAREDATRDVGVFVGAVWAMYQMLGVEEQHLGNKISPSSFLWSIANRVSYWMNLSGPSLTLDTACSSSLTAIYLACEAIHAGDCSSAIVGGVNLDLHQAKIDINSNGGALSVDGVCRSFGKGANGYVAGEGIGALYLKPLDRAVRDGDNIYGVIKSAVVNHGGRASGYTVPNPRAQSNLIEAALERAHVDARSIGYIEAHGTGTELGDPLEITGLTDAFKTYAVDDQTCAIGSIKSNIGHLEAAAGVVSVSKVLLQMKHRQLVPSLHSSELNEFIDFEHSPFYVVQQLEEWKPTQVNGVTLPLRAGISSFGAGGSNAHIILESYEPAEQVGARTALSGELVFPLSAKNDEQLRESAGRLMKFLQRGTEELIDIAHTLQIGRKSFDHRLAVVAGTREELIGKLTAFSEGRKAEHIITGVVTSAEAVTRLLNRREKEEFVRLLSQRRDPHKLAELWVEGLLADWSGLPSHASEKRVSLPTYPFADRRHWIGQKSATRQALSLQPAAGMHPMVDTNESTFERQLFKKTFHDRDFFIYDHLVADIPTLPGVAYLEFARKAGESAAGRPVRKIRNILWVSPISVESSVPKDVFIELKPSGDTVQFEVFSDGASGKKSLHSQGKILYTTREEAAAEPEYIDLAAIRARCVKAIDGATAYPLFKSFGLNLGPSFQVLQDVYKNENEILGVLKLPEFRQGDLDSMVLLPSLVDGSLQTGMAALLGEKVDEMLVPFSIGEVEILHPLQSNCFSYVTEVKDDRKDKKESAARVVKTNVLILDETGKILVKIRDCAGVPLREVHEKPAPQTDADGFSRVYFSYEWEKAPLDDAKQNAPQSILLFATDETLRDLYRERLRAAGADPAGVILVRPGDSFENPDGQSYTVNPRSKDDFTRLFETLVQRDAPIENICFAWPIGHPGFRDEQVLGESLESGVSSFLFVCQSLVEQKLESKVQLLYVYATPTGEAQPHHEAVSGFVNTLRVEHSKLLCKSLEIRRGDGSQILDAVAAEFHAHTQDAAAVRYEGGARSVKRLKSFDLGETGAASAAAGIGLKEQGVYLITGGAGGLGLIFAEFLAKEHKARLVLTGRSSLSPEREAKLEELRKLGAEVVYVLADVSSQEDVARLIDETKTRFGRLDGIIHSAGVVRDSYVRNKTPEEMRAVFAPKLYGTLHLDEATRNEALDFFVTFSSLAAVAGNAGQSDYSFANAFMDAFAADRERLRAEGTRSGKTLSVNWSLWAEGGMKPDEQTELYFRKTLGMKPLSTAAGIDAFVRGLASPRSQFAVLEGLPEKLEQAWGEKKKAAPPAAAVAVASAGQAPAAGADAGDGALLAWLQKELSLIVMEFLKLEASDVSPDKILLDLGFDSIGLTTFANAVNEKFQLDITPILFFDYPSIGEIAKHLTVERKSELLQFYRGPALATPASAAPAGTPAPAAHQPATNAAVEVHQAPAFAIAKGWNPAALDRDAAPSPSGGGSLSPEMRFVNQPMAIVGMSGVMPQSEDLDEFWENLKSSRDLVTVIPPDRWRWEDFDGDPLKEVNKSSSKWGGFMKEIDKFDPLFFGISPREAQMMDPQQRLFLEHVWKAVEDSGQKVSELAGSRTGVFVGAATTDYSEILRSNHIALDGYSASGNSHSVLANRVSFLLGLRGPSAPLDTACSSSLVALHRAIESIHTGSCDMAIVGGVQVMLSPAAYISFSAAGMLSDDGKCKTFDKRANGYVRGEGCGAIFIKSLAAAEADGNHIYAVIKATAENHGGRVTTLTAPNSAAQTELLIEAYEKAHIDPTTVGYIECHGTGTSLGDPIEVQSLSKAFSELYKRNAKAPAVTPHCGLSSVKTNIGHLETGAGIAGVIKVLLAIKHKQIPANLHLEEVNPYINLKGTPFYIADKLTPWEAAISADGSLAPRRAGVSSFGFGGANAHIVLEEYLPPMRHTTASQTPQLIVLSAKNEDRLNAYVRSMHAYLGKGPVDLTDFAYTLQVGRDEMPERLAFAVSSTEELQQKFEEILQGDGMPRGGYRENIKKGPKSQVLDGFDETVLASLLERKELAKLAELWVSGAKIDWRLLHKSDVLRRLSVPSYPFARERHWIPVEDAATAQQGLDSAPSATARLHPMIHRNVSTLKEQKFASTFTGSEFYLADHRVRTEAVLPAVAYIEMAAAAGELSGEQKVRVIRNMVWLSPLTVGDEAKEIEVSLSPDTNEVDFAIRTVDHGHSLIHCRGKLTYLGPTEADALDVAEIQRRCSEEIIDGKDLYPFLATSELNFGKGFQVVQHVYAGRSESLAVLQLPEHLRDGLEQFWLHPALLDGAVHTAIGMVKKRNEAIPWIVPSSVDEVRIFGSLKDVHYAHATWAADGLADARSPIRIQIQLLDRDGRVLVAMKDFIAKPFHPLTSQEPGLQWLLPVWNPARIEVHERILPEDREVLVLGTGGAPVDWVRELYPSARHLSLDPGASIDAIEKSLAERSFDHLLWFAPDVSVDTGGRIIDQQEEGALALFRIVKALLHLGYATKKVQWTFVTCRTQHVTDAESLQPAHAGVAGLVGSLAKEYPQWSLRLLDLDSLASVSARECLSLPWDKQGNALARRQGEWFRQELSLMDAPPEATGTPYRQNGVYVVIGGAGGVGEVWSRFMIEHYQANIVWIGRREPDSAIEKKIEMLSGLGPAPLYIAADAADAASLGLARSKVLETHPRIHGVVHSAIVLQDQSLLRMEEPAFRASFSAKVDVSVNLDEVFGNEELDFMLFFSSIVSFAKSPGQSNYSAGSTFEDSFAHALQQRRPYPVKIMNWGYWGNVGVVADEFHNRIMAQMGIGSIEPDEGTAALQRLIGSAVSQAALIKTLDGDAAAGRHLAEAMIHGAAAAAPAQQAAKPVPTKPATSGMRKAEGTSSPAEVTEQMSNDYIRRIITDKLSDALRMNAATIGNDSPFADYGVDSIIGVNLVRTINEALQIRLEPTSLFECSTINELTAYIVKHWQPQIAAQLAPLQVSTPVSSPAAAVAPPEVPPVVANRFIRSEAVIEVQAIDETRSMVAEPIAIIGMSGRFAESESLDAFWQHLADGDELIKQVSRWSPADCVMSGSAGKAYCTQGSFLDSADQFDPAFFGISALEATYMDPQQRLFLEESWRALEDAGYAGKGVQEKQCGVYVGCGTSNYTDLFVDEPPPQAWWGNSQSVVPARIAYSLNLLGPAIAVDTACSSALVAIHLACQSLWSRETEMALAGGVYIQATSGFHKVANRAGMLSVEGKCYSFDARANGFVPGEAVGVVVLKRLRDALQDGDHIHGVIAGSGINQDGRSNGLIAPNGRAQERLERAVYDRFEIDPETIQFVEAHATATAMGDSIEHLAISRAFREYTDKKQFCAIGSVKTNIGHAGSAAGIASLLKVLLSLKHRQIPPSLHFEKSNPAIDFEAGPFYVNTQLQPWAVEDDDARRAAVSSFGFSGTNAHLVIEEAPAVERAAAELPGYLLVLSARTAEQLKEQARNLLALAKSTADLPLNDVSYTLITGRTHFSHRLSCVVRNQAELIQLLGQWVETGAANHVYTSEIHESKVWEQVSLKKFGNYCIQECRNATDAASYLENLAAVADLYVQGYALDFAALFSADSKRFPLPTYPFARERYWIDAVRPVTPRLRAATTVTARPVLAAVAPPRPQSSGPAFTGGEEDLFEWLQNDLTQIASELLNVDAGELSPDRILLDLGFDSIGLTTFAKSINERYQLNINPVLFFDYPSLGEIAKHLSAEHGSEIRRIDLGAVHSAQTVAPAALAQHPAEITRPGSSFSAEHRFVNEPIAIVGISGVMPQCDDLDALWEGLKGSKNLVTVIPEDRWHWEDYYGDPLKEVNKSNSKWGGFIHDVDKFDPLFFGISPREAQMMDPQQRIFLETVWKAIEDSGQKVSDLSGTRTGLFVGVGSNDYLDLLRNEPLLLDGYTASGNTHSVLANRVSFLLNLRGPSAPIDTACSSSLVALHRAIESIHTRSCDMAIVGGVQVILSPGPYISFSMAGMLSSDGECKTFDKSANGYVRGEGAGAMLLKPLSAAEADGNHIYAVIKATAENHGGRVTTLTAPNSAAQSALLIDAYEKAEIDPATVQYIECHGTGTSLGDPIEVQALSKAFSELYKRRNQVPAEVPHCGLGSIKTNIGHLETAAGMAGIFKVLLSMKNRQIPANLHFEELNPYITLTGTPFYIADRLASWEPTVDEEGSTVPRRAGVSSFGFGGANAHVVLEEYIPPVRQAAAAADEPQLIVLSAKNEDRLKAYLRSMLAYLDKGAVELADFAYTLQVGRDEMPERLALVASSIEELKQKFTGVIRGGEAPQGVYRNHVRDRQAKSRTAADTGNEVSVQSLIEQGELFQLAERWVSGAKIDWHLLHGSDAPMRISIPTYPFARDRYWFPSTGGSSRPAQTKATSPEGAVRPAARGSEEVKPGLHSFVPVWKPVRVDTNERIVVQETTRFLLLGSDSSQLEWVRKSYPESELLEIASPSGIDTIADQLRGRSFDQLLWIAPDATVHGAPESNDRALLVDRQEQGVLALFRIIKALLHLGYASRGLQWTVVTARTQQVTDGEPIQSAHAGVAGLIGSLAKEYPRWDLRLVDVDSLDSVAAQECLSLPWDKQGNALVHRQGEWFRQTLEPIAALPQATPLYRKDGVYVVIGGAGGIGEVWSRFMIEHYQARVIWIGRRQYDAVIEDKIQSLARLGHAPLYIAADATNLDSLEQARKTILKAYPAIHGVVHSALVLDDQSIARMDESVFRASLSAKVDVSVNMDRAFGGQELDFMLFFSSIVSFVRSAGQSNYAAGCTFKDAFAHLLQQQRAYPVKIMNWGYWGDVGVAADEAHRKNMARMGLGSIEPLEGMTSLQALMSSDVRQVALIKTVDRKAAVRPAEAVTAAPKAAPRVPPPGRGGEIRRIIVENLAEALRMDASLIRNDTPLADYGVDSIVGVNLVGTLSEVLDIELEAASLFDYQTVDELAEYILTRWQPQIADPPASSPEIARPARRIRKLASYLTATHPERPGTSRQAPAPAPSEQAGTTTFLSELSGAVLNREELLDEILWSEASPDGSYEKVTF